MCDVFRPVARLCCVSFTGVEAISAMFLGVISEEC